MTLVGAYTSGVQQKINPNMVAAKYRFVRADYAHITDAMQNKLKSQI